MNVLAAYVITFPNPDTVRLTVVTYDDNGLRQDMEFDTDSFDEILAKVAEIKKRMDESSPGNVPLQEFIVE